MTLVVVTYNSAAVLPAFAAALPEALQDVARSSVVVVDNASTDGTPELAAALLPGCRVVPMGRNAGYAAAVNSGVDAAPPDGDVLVLNPDVRLGPRCVRRLLDTQAATGAGIVVPRLIDPSGRLHRSLRRRPTLGRALGEAVLGERAGRLAACGEVVSSPGAYRRVSTADWATGAAVLVTRACWRATGRWDESFFLYSEETDFCLRAQDAGFRLVFAPEATAVHLGGESVTSPELWSLLMANRVRLYRRRHRRVAAEAYRAALLLGALLRSGRGRTHRAAVRALTRPGQTADLSPTRPAPGGVPGYVCFSAQDWWYHNRAHSDFQLMRNIAAHRTVLFVNSIGMRMPLPGRSPMPWRRIARKVRSVAKLVRRPVVDLPRFVVMTPLLLPWYGNRVARALNARVVAAQVSLVARRLGIESPVVVVTIPTAVDVVRHLRHRRLLVNRSDRHSAFPEADGELIGGMEHELLNRADTVLYVSRALMAAESDRTGERAHFLDHGVDLHHFRVREAAHQPPALLGLPRPRVGFFGGFDDYIIDFDLLEKLAVGLDGAQLVLVGDATCPMDRLLAHPNVHWFGFQPYESIPAWGSGFDVGIMPWLDNAWIRFANPIKLKEYLALGLPVVSTDFPEAHHYPGLVDVAADADDFVAKVRHWLTADSPTLRDRRRTAVQAAGWDRRAADVIALAEAGRVGG